MGHEIEVRPGIVSKDTEGKLTCKPIFSKIVSLFAEQNDLQYGVPGGLIGKSLGLDSVYLVGSSINQLVYLVNSLVCVVDSLVSHLVCWGTHW